MNSISAVALGMVYPAMYFLTQMFKQEFVETGFLSNDNRIKFNQIKSAADFWNVREKSFY